MIILTLRLRHTLGLLLGTGSGGELIADPKNCDLPWCIWRVSKHHLRVRQSTSRPDRQIWWCWWALQPGHWTTQPWKFTLMYVCWSLKAQNRNRGVFTDSKTQSFDATTWVDKPYTDACVSVAHLTQGCYGSVLLPRGLPQTSSALTSHLTWHTLNSRRSHFVYPIQYRSSYLAMKLKVGWTPHTLVKP